MNRSVVTPFDEWVTFCFRDRATCDNCWHVDLEEEEVPWLGRDDAVAVDYFTRLHENGIRTLEPFSNEDVGAGLWALYSSASQLCPPFHVVSRSDLHRAIRAVGTFVAETMPQRLALDVEDRIYSAVYMFWDLVPIWPHRAGPFEAEDRCVCIEEMARCLRVDHPLARYHALHGLGHFELIAGNKATRVIDDWLTSEPAIDPTLTEYANLARMGNVR